MQSLFKVEANRPKTGQRDFSSNNDLEKFARSAECVDPEDDQRSDSPDVQLCIVQLQARS